MPTLLRIALVVGWLIFFGTHALHYALPDLGLKERRDVASILANNLDKDFLYDIQQVNRNEAPRVIGSARITFDHEDSSFRLSTHLEYTSLALMAGLDGLGKKRMLGQPLGQASLTFSQTLDHALRLTAIKVDAIGLGMRLSAKGTVDANGLKGTYRLDQGSDTPFAFPEISQDTNQGLDLAVTLPAGLRVGEKFSSSLIGGDFPSLTPRKKIAVFTVTNRESAETGSGPVPCLRVTMEVDGRPFATMWCDKEGTVYRNEQKGSGQVLVLKLLKTTDGVVLWPPEVAAQQQEPPEQQPRITPNDKQ